MMKIHFVTSNKKKLAVARNALKAYGIEVEQISLETPEIQSASTAEVAKYSAKYAAEKIGKPVIKGDVGFAIEALNNFPGPLVKFINESFSIKQFVRLYQNETNKRAYFIDALAYCKPSEEPVCFVTKTHGHLVTEPQGDNGIMVDALFVPDGYKKTVAALTKEEWLALWNNSRFQQLAEHLRPQNSPHAGK